MKHAIRQAHRLFSNIYLPKSIWLLDCMHETQDLHFTRARTVFFQNVAKINFLYQPGVCFQCGQWYGMLILASTFLQEKSSYKEKRVYIYGANNATEYGYVSFLVRLCINNRWITIHTDELSYLVDVRLSRRNKQILSSSIANQY